MNHRPAVAADSRRLKRFRCSTGQPFENDVERWINRKAFAWLHDLPYAAFQHRSLHVVEDEANELIAVFAWQDIVRVDVEGIWLEVLAVSLEHQHQGTGRAVLTAAKAHLVTTERDGDAIVALVHPDNDRSRRLVSDDGWIRVGELDGHDLMASRLPT